MVCDLVQLITPLNLIVSIKRSILWTAAAAVMKTTASVLNAIQKYEVGKLFRLLAETKSIKTNLLLGSLHQKRIGMNLYQKNITSTTFEDKQK